MARAARQRRENELPYIPFGPFQVRFPFIHYKLESVEFIQGLILGVTALAAVPYLEQYLGLPYELAWSCVIIETMLYMLHSLLGDPVVPGWITPTLPLTIVFLEGFPLGKERISWKWKVSTVTPTLSLSTAFTTSYAVPNWLIEQFGAPQNSREIFISAPTLSER